MAHVNTKESQAAVRSRLTHLEQTYVHAVWYETVNSGTSGTFAPPSGGTIELDRFASGVDALASTFSGANLTWQSPRTAGGAIIAATLDALGNWTITGTPSAYPIAVIYAYKVKLVSFDFSKCLIDYELEQNHNQLSDLQGGTTDQYYHLTSAEHTELNAWLPYVELKSNGDIVGKDFVQTRNATISRTGDDITSVALTGGSTYTLSYNGDDDVATVTDGTRTWTLTWSSGDVTAVTVT